MTGLCLLVLYQIAGTIAFLVGLPWAMLRAGLRPREMRERLGGGAGRSEAAPLWVHAASLGEMEGVRALLAERDRGFRAGRLLTVLSVSARDRAADLEAAGWRVRFLPLDLWCCLLLFLRRERPRGLLLVETELWPATLAFCRRRGIPVALISGRLSSRKWSRTKRLRPLLAPGLRAIEACAAQSEADAARFRALGLVRVEVLGNLKYHLVGPCPRPVGDDRFLFVAGSLRRGEEAVLEAIRASGVLAIVAPRHAREREAWAVALASHGLSVVRRSGTDLPVPARETRGDLRARQRLREALELRFRREADPAVLLLDTHGELGAWYAAADAAFVGGTLVPLGGHNLFEPAREGVPVAFGPHTSGVRDLAEPLLRAGGGEEVRDAGELAAWLRDLRSDPSSRAERSRAAYAAAAEVAGAAARTWQFLETLPWTGVTRTEPQ